jgi:hypothetical protein
MMPAATATTADPRMIVGSRAFRVSWTLKRWPSGPSAMAVGWTKRNSVKTAPTQNAPAPMWISRRIKTSTAVRA